MDNNTAQLSAVSFCKGVVGMFAVRLLSLIALLDAICSQKDAKPSELALRRRQACKRIQTGKMNVEGGVPISIRRVTINLSMLRDLLEEAHVVPTLPKFSSVADALAFLVAAGLVRDPQLDGEWIIDDELDLIAYCSAQGLTIPDGNDRRQVVAEDLLASAVAPTSASPAAAKPKPEPEAPKK
jgi:hypothetical protein